MFRPQHFLLVFMWLPGEVFLISLSDCGPSDTGSCISAEPFVYGTIGQQTELSVQYVIPSGFDITQILIVKPRDDQTAVTISLTLPPAAPIIAGPFQGQMEVTDTGTADTRTLTLRILSVTDDDLDSYRTSVQYTGDDIFVAATTTMLALPVPPDPVLSISGYNSGVSAGTSLPLTCTSSQGKPPAQVSWWKGDMEQQQAVYSSSPNASNNQGDAMSVLTLAVQPANNQETYQCRVSQLGTELERRGLQINVRFQTSSPSLTVSPGAVNSGGSLTLTCTSGSSNPPASISWTQVGGAAPTATDLPETDGQHGGKITSQQVRLTNLQPQDNGAQFRCTATNSLLGQSTGSLDSAVVTINVRFYLEGSRITGNTPVTNGSSLTLTCTSGSSNPPASISWTRVGGAAPTGTDRPQTEGQHGGKITSQQVRLTNLQAQDNGAQFRCTVTNSDVSQREEKTVTIDVQYAPTNVRVTCNPSDLSDLREGGDLVCTCTAESNPAARYSWIKDSTAGPLPVGAVVDQTAGTLTFRLNRTHTGEYKCTADNDVSPDATSDGITVSVKYAPDEPTIVANATAVEEGDSVQLTCQTTSNPPASYSWTRQPGELPDDAGVDTTGQVLVIPGLTKDDSGTYICTASNVVLPGRITKDYVLTVLYLHQPMLSSNDVSIIAGSPQQATVHENTSVSFTCTADATPTADIKWTGPQGEVTNGEQLLLSPVEQTQAGNYTCEASNNIKGEERSKDVTLEIIVNYPASIISITPTVTVDEFDDVSLTCTADSNPAPNSFSWTDINGNSLPGDISNQGLTLTTTITDITYLQAGTYTCTAGNGIGAAASAVTNVTVEYAPKFYTTPDLYPASIGDDISMNCSAFAVPNKITFTWSKNETFLTNSSRLTIQSSGETSVLSISGVEEGDYGNYNCIAANEKGSSMTNMTLQPLGPPGKPTGLAVVSKNAEFEVGITWTAGFNGGLDTTHTVQLIKAGADQWEDVGSWEQTVSQQRRTFDVTLNLKTQEAGDYQIRVEARNDKGEEWSDPVNLKLEENQRLYGTITRDVAWVEALQDKQSAEFREKAALWENNLNKVFNPVVGYEGATITQFRQGSVVGDFEAVVAQSETQAAIDAFNARVSAGSVGDLTVVKGSSTISDTKPPDPPVEGNTLIIIIAVVCVVVVLAIVGVGVFVVRRRKSANDKKDVELRERITRDDRPSLNGLSNPGLDTENSPDPAYAEVPSNGAVPMAGGNPYDDVHFEGDGTKAPVAGAAAGPLDPNVEYATVNKNNNETPNPSTIYAQVDKDKKKKDKEKPTLAVDPSSEYATVDKSKKKKKDMPPPPEDPSAQYSEVKKDKKKGKKDMPPTPEDPSAQYSEVKKDKKKDKKAPAPDVIYTEVVKDKKDKKEKKDKKKPTPGKKPAVAKKPTAKEEERLYDEVPKAEGAAAVTDENPYENPQESMPEKQKNPQGLIYAELSDFQVKPPPKKPSKPAPPKPRYEDEPTEYASINWNASRRRAKEREQSGSTTDDETPVTMI